MDVKPPPVTLVFEGSNGAILNAGSLTVDPGQNLALIADTIANTGSLTAPGGEITLLAVPAVATGELKQVNLSASGQFLGVDAIVTEAIADSTALPTLTDLIAAAGAETGLSVTESGNIQVTSADPGIEISPTAGTALVSGTLEVSTPRTPHPTPRPPGTVQVSGDRVALLDATIDASGHTAGGTVLIGGDYQGQGTLPTASRTLVNQDSTIGADALEQGDGGRVIVWGNETTSFHGNISARGGSHSGDGGFVEVSGKDTLDFQGSVDTAAPNGNFGTLLLDPTNIIVVAAGFETSDLNDVLDAAIPDIGGDGDTKLDVAAIDNAAANIILQATNNITFDAQVNIGAAGVGLTAMANNNIFVSKTVDTNGGDLVFQAGGSIIASGIKLDSDATFGRGGNITLMAGGSISTGEIDASGGADIGGDITLAANGDIETGLVESSSISFASQGEKIQFTSYNGSISTGNIDSTSSFFGLDSGDSGDIILTARNNIATGEVLSGSIGGNGGRIDFTSRQGAIDTTNGTLTSGSVLGDGGAIMLNADRGIVTGDILSSSQTENSGSIDLISRQGSIDTTRGALVSGSVSGHGGAIHLTVHQGNITSRDLVSATFNQGSGNVSTGSGGAITMNANGNIAVGFANSSSTAISEGVGGSATAGSGGDIRMRANGSLSTGNLISWSSATASETATAGSGGNIHLSANGNISTTGLDASALTLTPAVSDLVSIQSLADSSELLPAALASVRSGNGGNLTLHSSGHLSLQGRAIATGGVGGPGISGVLPTGDGGTVDFRAGGNLTLAPSVGIIEVSGRSGGRIDLHSNQAIAVTDSFISSNSAGNGKGKGIHLVAPFIFIQGGRNGSTPLNSRTFGTGKAGDFTIDTNHLRLQGTRIAASTSSSGPSGRLTVNATNLVELSDGSSLKSQSFGSGVAGDITVNTKQLKLRGGSRISAATFDAGQGGNIIVNASDLVDLSGFLLEPDNRLEATRFDAGTAGSGAGGNITVNTRKLLVSEGAAIYTGSTSLSQGRGGTTTINALESVELRGTALAGALSSGLISDSPGGGDGGNIQVNTRRLTVRDGATISSSTLRQGEGGTVDINASETVELQGTAPDGRPSGIFSLAGTAGVSQMFLEQALREFPEEELIIFDAEDFANLPADFALRVRPTLSELLSDQPAATGQGGDVNIRTERLTVQEGAQVGVSGQFADLDAGNINIESRSILLDRGSIVAETASGEGGNINLWVQDLLLLRHGSQISTTAGTAQAGGNGGNITIDAGFVVAVPGENSDITANAFTGNGGNIRIRTNGIFGLGFRPHLTPLSDITASSEFGVDGTFTLDLLVPVDVSRGLGNLPQEQKPAELDRGCYGKGGRGSTELYDIGRGGIAAGPEEPLEGNALEWVGQTIDSEKMDSEAEEVQTAAAQAGDSRHEVAQLSTEELRPPCRRRSQPEDL